MILILSVNGDGVISLWDSKEERSKGMNPSEYTVDLTINAKQYEELQLAKRMARENENFIKSMSKK